MIPVHAKLLLNRFGFVVPEQGDGIHGEQPALSNWEGRAATRAAAVGLQNRSHLWQNNRKTQIGSQTPNLGCKTQIVADFDMISGDH